MSLLDFGIGAVERFDQQFSSPENIANMQRSFERGFGSYDVEKDPQYWESVVMAEELQSPEAQRAVWEEYQDFLPYEDFDSFTENVFRGAEGTQRWYDERSLQRADEIEEVDTDFHVDVYDDFRRTEIDYQELMLPEELERLILSNEMTQYEFDEHRERRDYRDFMTNVEMSIAEMEEEGMELSLEEQQAWHKTLDDRISMKMEEMGLNLESARFNRDLNEINAEIAAATKDHQIEQAQVQLDTMKEQLTQSKTLFPYEEEMLRKRIELLEAQIAGQRAQNLATSFGTGLGDGEGIDGWEQRDLNEYERAVRSLFSIGDNEEAASIYHPYHEGSRLVDFLPTMVDEETGYIIDMHTNKPYVEDDWGNPYHVSQLPNNVIEEHLPQLFQQHIQPEVGQTYTSLIDRELQSYRSVRGDKSSGGFSSGQLGGGQDLANLQSLENFEPSMPTQEFINEIPEGFPNTAQGAIDYLRAYEAGVSAETQDFNQANEIINQNMRNMSDLYGISIEQLISELVKLREIEDFSGRE